MPQPITLHTGERYGRLTVAQDRLPGMPKVQVRCDCGKDLSVSLNNLRSGNTKSCGCLKTETTVAVSTRHGMAGTRIYNIWSDMIARCERVTHQRYSSYGGRGIAVCERWRDFANFYADMGDRPEGRSLDRINNDRGYSPENCRWATPSQQMKNRRPEGVQGIIERTRRRKAEVAEVAGRIRERYAAGGVRQIDLAKEFGVSKTRICQIVNGS
jgi:hypothetical protein